MCQFDDFQAIGQNFDLTGFPTQVEVFGRVSEDCTSVEVKVFDNSNDLVFQGVVTPTGPGSVIGGVQFLNVIATFENKTIRCDQRLTIEMTCLASGTCNHKETVILVCKDQPPQCPDSDILGINLEVNGTVITEDQQCAPAGLYTATLNGMPVGGVISWFLQIGANTNLIGSANLIQFNVPPGTELVVITAFVTVPDCPPISKSRVLPDRAADDCPSAVTFEIRRNGTPVSETLDLDCGNYEMVVLAPLGGGIDYTFTKDGNLEQSGPSPTFDVGPLGAAATCNLIVTASPDGDCCPPVSTATTLSTKAQCEPGTEPEDPQDDNDDSDDPGGWSICGFIYALLMIAVFAFIALWTASFAFFPVSAAVWTALGIAFAAVLLLLGLYSIVCGMSACRRWRVLAWMFLWCSLGCLLAWAASLFTLWSLLIGALIAGVITLTIGLIMNNRGCSFPNPFALP